MFARPIAVLAFSLALPVATAFAQSAAPAAAPAVDVRTACKADMDKLCAGVERGDARRACMDTNKDKFSDGCKAARTAADARREAFRAACAGDVAKLCATVEKGQGRAAVECVRANADNVTPACKTQLSQLPEGGPGAEPAAAQK
jgi:hypothetical protein